MADIYQEEKVRELLDSAHSIAVIPSPLAKVDSFSAGAGLFHALRQLGKDVSLLYVGDVPDQCTDLVGPSLITSEVGTRQLVISIDYSDSPASKLAYSNDDGVLRLVLSPVSSDFDLGKVKTSLVGHQFDLIIVVGAQNLEDLGSVYASLHDSFDVAPVINLDIHASNTRFGKLNIIDTQANTLSAVVFKLLSNQNIIPDTASAKALLLGLTYRVS